jgi:hypothetical protein
MVSHFFRRRTLSLFHENSQKVYELHCDEVQVFQEFFQNITPALNQAFSEYVFNKKNTFLNWKNHSE